MMYKIWRKFFLLAVLGLMPVLSQAFCTSTWGRGTVGLQPYPGGVRLLITTSVTLTGTITCAISPTNLTPLGQQNGLPKKITSNGMTVDFTKVKVNVSGNTLTCTVQNPGTSTVILNSQAGGGCAGQTIGLRFEYLLEGTSTTSADVVLFTPQISSVENAQQPQTTSTQTFPAIKVPKSTAPTCNFLIDQPNITLDTLSLSDIANLTAGTAVASVQRSINITVNCATGALSANTTFAPQFSPTKSAVLTGNSSVALNDGTDNGVGFKLFDSSGNALVFKTALTSTNTQFAFTPTLQTVTKAFSFKYAKTSQAVKVGPVTSSITVTFSIL